jgi:hypothetical protein
MSYACICDRKEKREREKDVLFIAINQMRTDE